MPRRLPLAACLSLLAALGGAEAEPSAPGPVPGAAPAEAAPDAAGAWTLPGGDAAAIDALLALALRHGLPDARGAVGVVGTLAVEWQGDPARAPQALAVLHPHLESTSLDGDTATLHAAWPGRHLRLADGSWLLGCTRHAAPGDGFSVTPQDGARELPPGDLLAAPAGEADERRQGLRWRLGPARGWVDGHAAVERALAVAPVDPSGRLDPLAVVHLWRAGAGQARDLALLCALLAQADPGDAAAPAGTPPSFGGAGDDAPAPGEGAFHPPGPGDVPATLRASLAGWALVRLIVADHAGRAAALAGARALAADDAAAVANCEAVAAGRALPAEVPADAPLSARLACWRPSGAQDEAPRHGVLDDGGAGYLAQEDAALRLAALVREDDLDTLVALAADARPSRWIDRGLARSLGDNALRAVARLLHDDPRSLAGRPLDARWNAAERNAVATGLARWWQANRGRGLAALRAEAVVRKPLAQALALIEAEGEPARKAALAAALGRCWQERPPRPRDAAECLGELAALVAEQRALPAFAAGPARWRATPATAALLAAWRALAGDGAAIVATLAEAGEQVDDTPDSPALLRRAIALAAATPDAARLAALRALLARDGGSAWEVAVAWLAQPHDNGLDGLDPLVEAVHPGGLDRQLTVRLALLHQLLGDQRPLPDGLLRAPGGQLHLAAAGDDGAWPLGGGRPMPEPAPRLGQGLRRCDLAAWVAAEHAGALGMPDPPEGQAIDLARTPAERDAAVAAARKAVGGLAEAALDAAGLPRPDAGAQTPRRDF